ncbi:MAG TPA: helix-turn-helix domain-containing protein [Thermoanaerobaculia bacterium]|nr:helix-turn-helix domain-containing protein [Thermoanaerobaculia bacterium]
MIGNPGQLHFEHLEHDSALGSWSLTTARPLGALGSWVESLWIASSSDCYAQERILPRSTTMILFNLVPHPQYLEEGGGRRGFLTSWVSGLQQGPLEIFPSRQICNVGIQLRPSGALPVLGVPPSEVAGQVVDLDQLFGPGVEEVRMRMIDEPSPRSRLLLLASALERRLTDPPRLRGEVLEALGVLHASRGKVPIHRLVRGSGWSERTFIQRFREQVGLNPKRYARVLRFETAMTGLLGIERVCWADFAVAHGWFDQAHMARDFRELAGATPLEVWRHQSPDGLSLLETESR